MKKKKIIIAIDGEHWSAQLLTENPYDEVGCLCHGGSWL